MPLIRWNGHSIRLKGHGHYLVSHGKTVYMAPELLLHYLRKHRYCPPPDFIKEVVANRLMILTGA